MDFTLKDFVGKLAEMTIAVHEAEGSALERAAVTVEREAKTEIGSTGDVRDTIEHTVVGAEARVGSNSENAVSQEFGTAHMPPRSFLASALMHEADEVVRIVRNAVVGALIGCEVEGGR